MRTPLENKLPRWRAMGSGQTRAAPYTPSALGLGRVSQNPLLTLVPGKRGPGVSKGQGSFPMVPRN